MEALTTLAEAGEAVLAFQAITQRFPAPSGGAPLTVIDDVAFNVARGRFVAVSGPSGCGKSTLLQMAAGLLRPSAGRTLHQGREIVGVNRAVGLVPQQA